MTNSVVWVWCLRWGSFEYRGQQNCRMNRFCEKLASHENCQLWSSRGWWIFWTYHSEIKGEMGERLMIIGIINGKWPPRLHYGRILFGKTQYSSSVEYVRQSVRWSVPVAEINTSLINLTIPRVTTTDDDFISSV